MTQRLAYYMKEVKRGDEASFSLTFLWKNPATGEIENLPVNTATAIYMDIRNGDNDRAALIARLTVGSGLTVTVDSETGKITISGLLTSTITNKFPVSGTYYADMRFDFDGSVITLIDMYIKVVSNVSKN